MACLSVTARATGWAMTTLPRAAIAEMSEKRILSIGCGLRGGEWVVKSLECVEVLREVMMLMPMMRDERYDPEVVENGSYITEILEYIKGEEDGEDIISVVSESGVQEDDRHPSPTCG